MSLKEIENLILLISQSQNISRTESVKILLSDIEEDLSNTFKAYDYTLLGAREYLLSQLNMERRKCLI